MNRRQFLSLSGAAGSTLLVPRAISSGFPAIITSPQSRPLASWGTQVGDITARSGIVWSRVDRPARLIVEWARDESFRDARHINGPRALDASDFTARLPLSALPPGERIFYRVTWQSLADARALSEPLQGSFRTAPLRDRKIRFVWGGDVVGQGWGINPEFGGMKIFEVMRRLEPDFFIHSGDSIYADGPLQAEVKLDDGSIWRNLTTPEKAKVAETLAEFRGHHRYNLLDDNLRRFNAEVPVLAQWDDHEVRNNWYPGQILDDARYTEKRVDVLAKYGRRAFLEYFPLAHQARDPQRIYRAFSYGPLLEVIMLDERSYRGPNTANNQTTRTRETDFLGPAQLRWAKQRLLSSRATWKVIASDMPIGYIVPDGSKAYENCANGDGPPLGRELETADLLRFIKDHRIRNVVWVTTDVHHAGANYYDPARAQFTEFDPFWEFIAGPLNAGSFNPLKIDNTFGLQVKFVSVPPGMKANRPPSDGLQFFGAVEIDAQTKVMTVAIYNLAGEKIYTIDLPPTT
jgi:alkaline phosphatase D